MTCQVVNSQSQVQARLPPLPANLPQNQGDWGAFIASLNQWAIALQNDQQPINVIPAQYSLFQGSNLPKLDLSTGMSATLDSGALYYGASSLKVVSVAGGTLAFDGFPIVMAPAQKWFCAWQIYTPTALTGTLTVTTDAGNSVSHTFSIPSGQGALVTDPVLQNITDTAGNQIVGTDWQQVWGIFDLQSFAATHCTWKFTFDQAATFWIDGLQMAVGGMLFIQPIPFGNPQPHASIDALPDGSTYQRMPSANMDTDRRALINYSSTQHVGVFDPSSAFFGGKGSTPPSVPNQQFSYTSTTTTISITWPAMTIYRADGTTLAVSSGSQAITGLTASTTYKFYPYVNDAGGATTVSWATGGTGVGSPAIAYASTGDVVAAATMYARGNIPLNSWTGATTASGSGGGGGGGSGCLHPDTLVMLADGSGREANRLMVGMELLGPYGPVKIARIERRPAKRWITVWLKGWHTVTPDHRFQLPDTSSVRAEDLKLGQIVAGRGEHLEVTGLSLLRESASLVSIELEAPHLYYLACGALSHNPKP